MNNQCDMSHWSAGRDWPKREGFKEFGDRLNFLSGDAAHLSTGKLKILPPRGEKKRDGSS